jgi:hypothetical protein
MRVPAERRRAAPKVGIASASRQGARRTRNGAGTLAQPHGQRNDASPRRKHSEFQTQLGQGLVGIALFRAVGFTIRQR